MLNAVCNNGRRSSGASGQSRARDRDQTDFQPTPDGSISANRKGVLVLSDKAYDKKCDFCIPARLARWDYPAESFVYQAPLMPLFVSKGGWLACEQCAHMIEEGNIRGLTSGLPAWGNFRAHKRAMVKLFIQHRTGERVPFG